MSGSFTLQGDQFNMTVFFRYLVKGDLSSVLGYSSVHLTSDFFTKYQKIMFSWSPYVSDPLSSILVLTLRACGNDCPVPSKRRTFALLALGLPIFM